MIYKTSISFKMSIPSTTAEDSPRSPSSSTGLKPFGSTAPYAEPLWYSRNVSPHYTESHGKLRAAVRKYVDEEILPYAFEWESAGKVPDAACDLTFLCNELWLMRWIGFQTTC